MGVYISLYAVDLARLEPFLDRSLASMLWYHAKHGVGKPDEDDHEPYYGVVSSDYSTEYISFPRRGGVKKNRLRSSQPLTDLTEGESFTDPFLAIKVKDYLGEDSYYIANFLGALEDCPEAKAVRCISKGYRRWWIGSFLDCVDKNKYASPQEYSQLVAMFQKVLRVYNCGKPLPESSYELANLTFPVIPEEDIDLWMGVWTEGEVSFILQFIHSLLEQHGPFFRAPAGTMPVPDSKKPSMAWDDPLLAQMVLQEHNPDNAAAGLASGMTDAEWNEWVHRMLDQLLRIEGLGYERPNVVSFLSS